MNGSMPRDCRAAVCANLYPRLLFVSIKFAVQHLIFIADAKLFVLYLREVNVELILIQQLHQQRLLLLHIPDSDEIIYRVFRHFGIDIPIEE